MRASAGITAAAACHWERAEEHQWYADMLFARDMGGDRERARELLREALLMCQSVGMRWYVQHVEQRIQGAVARVV
jgi:hypothetical protein